MCAAVVVYLRRYLQRLLLWLTPAALVAGWCLTLSHSVQPDMTTSIA